MKTLSQLAPWDRVEVAPETTEPIEPIEPGVLPFAIAGGRVCGTEHRRTGRPCQDAYAWQRSTHGLVAVVCDGCGSGRHSEVGATLGARLLAATLLRAIEDRALGARASVAEDWMTVFIGELWPVVRAEVVAHLRALANAMSGSLPQVVVDHFLFTAVGAVVTPAVTLVFSLGDGVYGLDRHVREIGPYPDNRPPYLGYDLLDGAPVHGIDVHACVATDELTSVLLATDGALPLMPAAAREALLLPGSERPAGDLLQFAEPRFVANGDAIRRRLWQMNRERRDIDWQAARVQVARGLLLDDTAVVSIQRVHGVRS